MRYILFLLALMFANVANAMDCEKVPDCASLGYSKDNDPNCADNGYMYCPFDKSYKRCVNYDCTKLGFTESDKTSWCADIIKCRGNENLTLCQKACIATNYDELKYLAGSGKCKLITMKSDITIPTNQGFTLAANTTIDGGGHTLSTSANQANKTVITAENNTAFKNINLHHQDSITHNNNVYLNSSNTENEISLENVSLIYDSKVTENQINVAFNKATYVLKDKIDLDINSIHCNVFTSSKVQFAGTDLTASFTNPNGSVFHGSELTFENAQINITKANTFSNGAPFRFKGTTANITAEKLFAYDHKGEYVIEEGSRVTFNITERMTNEKQYKYNLVLSGTPQKPVFLELEGGSDLWPETIEITASNLTDTLVYKGVSYHPTASATTTLTDIPSSPNWTSK